MKLAKVLISSIVVLFTFITCVDTDYDLSNINTDNIIIGDSLVAPLGKTSLTLDQLLRVKDNTIIKKDASGNYSLSFSGSLDLDISRIESLKINLPPSIQNIPLNSIPPSLLNTPLFTSIHIQVPPVEASISYNYPNRVNSVDSVFFDVYNEQSTVTINLQCSGISTLSDGDALAVCKVVFPVTYDLMLITNTPGVTYSGRTLVVQIPINKLRNPTPVTLRVNKIYPKNVDRIVYASDIYFAKGAIIRSVDNPTISFNGSSINLLPQTIFGKFSMSMRNNINISTAGLSDIFQGDSLHLNFANPHIIFNTYSNVGIGLVTFINAKATTNTSVVSTNINGVEFNQALYPGAISESHFWVGPKIPNNIDGIIYDYIENYDLSKLIADAPNSISLDISTLTLFSLNSKQFIINPSRANADYRFVVPLIPQSNFKGRVSQDLINVFDEDVINYAFTTGNVDIYGFVRNSIPLDMDLILDIVDDKMNPVGISSSPISINGSADGEFVSSDLSFNISNADLPKLKTAKHIRLYISFRSEKQFAGISLNENQVLELNLKIKKTGGVNVNSKNN